MDPRNFVKVTILWMNFGNINFVCFTEEKLDLSLWAFGRLGVAVKFLRMLTPPLLLIVVLSLSLLRKDLVGLRQEIPKRGRYNHSQRGDS